MRVLITGATGFLGQYVVSAAVRRGHEVTALVRPSRELTDDFFPTGVSIARGDLRNASSLSAVLEDASRKALGNVLKKADAVIHLAACVVGDDDSQFASTVVGTENLLQAMIEHEVTRLVHCSTFSVYDWQEKSKQIDEESPLEPNLYARDGYAISKIWQERLVRRTAAENKWRLSVLRPGFIWGARHERIAGIGQSLGKWHLVIGGRRALPLTYVENCADCFVHALESSDSVGETYNVLDEETSTAWDYTGAGLKSGAFTGRRIPVPYWMGISLATLANWTSRLLFGPTGKLPGNFVPIKFRARFRPLDFPCQKLQQQLGWKPRYDLQAAWLRTLLEEKTLLAANPQASKTMRVEPEDSLV